MSKFIKVSDVDCFVRADTIKSVHLHRNELEIDWYFAINQYDESLVNLKVKVEKLWKKRTSESILAKIENCNTQISYLQSKKDEYMGLKKRCNVVITTDTREYYEIYDNKQDALNRINELLDELKNCG